MATRPWVLPEEVTGYTSFEDVKTRNEAKLAIDISRAEQRVIKYTNNPFGDVFSAIPDPVKTAVILLAEAYAHNAEEAPSKLKSETFDDYTYTVESSAVDVNSIELSDLLDEYIIAKSTGRVTMKLQRL